MHRSIERYARHASKTPRPRLTPGASGRWAIALLACLCIGCASRSTPRETSLSATSHTINADVSELIRSDVMGFADTHSARFTQALDEIVATDPPMAVRGFAIENRLGNAVATLSIAVAPNPFVALLDMVVMVTLKRQSIEERAVPGVLAGHGGKLLNAMRRSEADAWTMAAKYLDASQLAELHEQIRLWRIDNPDLDYVGFVRFSEFGAFRQFTKDSAKARPGSVFSLLYVDPLAKLDPVAQELHGYRALSERLTFMATRLPVLVGLEARAALWLASTDTPFMRVVNNTETAADAMDRFARATEKYPADLSRERQAAVEQLSAEITSQRKAIVTDLDQREAGVRAILADARGVVETADRTAVSIRKSADGIVGTSEQASRRILNQAFILAAAFMCLCLIGIPVAIWIFRKLTPRSRV